AALRPPWSRAHGAGSPTDRAGDGVEQQRRTSQHARVPARQRRESRPLETGVGPRRGRAVARAHSRRLAALLQRDRLVGKAPSGHYLAGVALLVRKYGGSSLANPERVAPAAGPGVG